MASGQNVKIKVGEIHTLMNIEYPGRIENPDKAVKTLGGIDKLSQVCCSLVYPDTTPVYCLTLAGLRLIGKPRRMSCDFKLHS